MNVKCNKKDITQGFVYVNKVWIISNCDYILVKMLNLLESYVLFELLIARLHVVKHFLTTTWLPTDLNLDICCHTNIDIVLWQHLGVHPPTRFIIFRDESTCVNTSTYWYLQASIYTLNRIPNKHRWKLLLLL